MLAAAHLRAKNYSLPTDAMTPEQLALEVVCATNEEFKPKEIQIETPDTQGNQAPLSSITPTHSIT